METHAGPYAGKTIDAVVRNSKLAQVGNARSVVQERALVAKLTAAGANVVLHDEQGTSGRDLSKRKVLLNVLHRVRTGQSHGIAYHDIKRFTRDEYGDGPAVIARVLVKHRAVLVTSQREYRLWLRQDLFDYRQECNLAGNDLLANRDQFFEGLLGRALQGAYFGHIPPVGYTTELVEYRPEGSRGPTQPRRLPVKDVDAAAMMDGLAVALDVSHSLSEVADTLNAAGLYPLASRGETAGSPRKWRAQRVSAVLTNSLYFGEWEWCRKSDQTNPVWYCVPANRPIDIRPDLAWFTAAQRRRWLARFVQPSPMPKQRRTPHKHRLAGVLSCANCGRPMVGHGKNGYLCQVAGVLPDGTGCSKPQSIGEAGAIRVLRDAIPAALAECADYAAEVRRQLAGDAAGDELVGEVATLEALIEQAVADWYDGDHAGSVPAGVKQRIAGWQAKLQLARSKLDAQRAAIAEAPDRVLLIEQLLATPADAIAKLSDDAACLIIRGLFMNVVIDASGHGPARRFVLRSWSNRLASTSVSDATRRSEDASLRTLLAQVAA